MKITAIVVTTLNGKITKGNVAGTGSWASKEDQQHFRDTLAAHDTLIMGSTTYDAARSSIDTSDSKTRIVMTKSRARHSVTASPAGTKFTDDSAQTIVRRLAEQGISQALLVGGGKIYSLFFDAGLVDELQLTLEPWLFTEGADFTSNLQTSIKFELLSCQQMNRSGTLLLKYKVLNPSYEAK